MKPKIMITLNDQGGAVMSWNYAELASTLRAEMSSSHPPVVVLQTYGIDSYNQTMQKETINPLRSGAGGDEKPMVLIVKKEGATCKKRTT